MTPPDAEQAENRSFSIVWLIPLIAALIGGWMVYNYITSQGPVVTLHFQTADGLEAGKTTIRTRNVNVGRVESVSLSKDTRTVLVTARVDPQSAHLLRKDSQFWVVRPRVGAAGVSGLETLVSGAYIELRPGSDQVLKAGPGRALVFTGLEQPPVTPPGTPGVRLSLYSSAGESLNVGDSVTYQGFTVGKIEKTIFDAERRRLSYELFIQAPYDRLVTTTTRFWNTSGVDITTSTEGVSINTGSLSSVLSGGVAFDIPQGWPHGKRAEDGDRYRLYGSRKLASEQRFRLYTEYLLLFDQSIRGLRPGAPVEFRGIRIGTVTGFSEKYLAEKGHYQGLIPVLIRIEPGRTGEFDEVRNDQELRRWVREGMRATLKSGNLLTGALYVDFDIYSDAEPAQVVEFMGTSVIPTVSSGLEGIAQRITTLLDTLNSLPLKSMVGNANRALTDFQSVAQALDNTISNVDALVAAKDTQAIPADIRQTLGELRHVADGFSPDSPMYHELSNTIQSLRDVLDKLEPVLETLNERPSALIFDKSDQPDLQPGGSQK